MIRIILLLLICFSANAAEVVKGSVTTPVGIVQPIKLTSTTSKGVTTTKGYVGNSYTKTKSTTAKDGTVTTKGWVGGNYVKIKSKKD